MIYLIGIIVGILNGLFASGAGQILVFYLVFIKKYETHISRALSVTIISIASIFGIIGYTNFIEIDIVKLVTLSIIAAIGGLIGSKLMKKIPANILNLVSGILIFILTLIKIMQGG